MNIEALVSEIGGLPFSVEPTHIRQKSRDFYWYSPVLKRQLDHVAADVIVTPKSEAEIVAIAAACYRHDAPLTVRGGGTGNYGQAMPLQGGVVLDMTSMDKLVWANKGACRVEAGKKLIDIDAELKPFGAELRMHPSTRAIATIGGFIGGGSGGVGSITWGMLHERGNIIAARLVTLEAEPRVLELRGDDVGKFNHSYGVTGVMTELEMGLAPVEDWIDGVVVFDDF
ncbi:MAG: FAD-binding oxidoreductase, partial [Hyphomonadaceae bacterium]